MIEKLYARGPHITYKKVFENIITLSYRHI